jgi:sporulation protein YlmC with PRC-barrel domain
MTDSRIIIGACAIGLLAAPANAQEADEQVTQTPQLAEACYQDLRAFGQRIRQEGYWLTGIRDRWGASAWTGTAPGTAYYPQVGLPPVSEMTDRQATVGADDETGLQPEPRAMWGYGMQSPGVQIEALFRAAHVLALRGDEDGCQVVLSELEGLYGDYVTRLQEAGVAPGEVAGWRQDRLLNAVPVSELDEDRLSVDEMTGREVRNLSDTYLGDIEDILISDGTLEYAVVSRGGFLDLGEDYVVVPWDRMSVTPTRDMFVLDASEQALEDAPEVSEDVLSLTDAQEDQVQQYWQDISE